MASAISHAGNRLNISLKVADSNRFIRLALFCGGAGPSACSLSEEDVVKTPLHHGRLPAPTQCWSVPEENVQSDSE